MTSINLILGPNSITNSILMVVRKHTNLGFSDIKMRIQNSSPIEIVDYLNNDGMEKLKVLVEELLKLGANIKLFEKLDNVDRELPLQHFMNSFELSRQIAEERERIDEILYGDDEDDE